MATGSGKTIVMAMLIAWAFCNRGRNPSSTQFPNAVLVIAPNLTVKERLQVLRSDTHDNYYDVFDLVPVKYRELLNAGKVLVTNWHAFAPKSPHKEGDTTYKVVDKGEETNDAFTLDRLGDLAARLPILVLNDEGHHCWRPNTAAQAAKLDAALNKEERERLEEEAEEARVWLAGLDRINNSGLIGAGIPSILAAVDLSATPFYLSNSGYPEGSPFPWLVSDFGLVDAIESGIVKVPRLPVKDDSEAKDEAGRPDPKYFRLWAHIKESLQPGADFVAKRPKPEALYREAEGALLTLAGQWKEKFDNQRKTSSESNPIPPVMIVVCDNTDLSQFVFENISEEKEVEVLGEDGKVMKKKIFQGSQINFPDLANAEGVQHTFRIDSKLLAKIETEGEETKDEAAQELRELIASVGKRGGKGEQVRCVVSVGMLTEGWDASNVTHVLGICRRFARDYPKLRVIRFASGRGAQEELGDSIEWKTETNELPTTACIVVATTAKWSLININFPFDVVFVEEAWQMGWADFMLLGQVTERFVLIGDPGQISPVVSVDVLRWETSPRPPHIAAPRVILDDPRQRPEKWQLPATRRLPHDAAALVRQFYDFDFAATAQPGERAILASPGGKGAADRVIDALAHNSVTGLTIPTPDEGPPMHHDAELAKHAAALVQRLLNRNARVRNGGKTRALEPEQIGMCSTHRVMNSELALALPRSLRGKVVVDTPERWQGLERPLMILVHPLSGVLRPTSFDLETGRLCVMASRHTAGAIILTRDHVTETLANCIPSATQPVGRPDVSGRGLFDNLAFWSSLQERDQVQTLMS
jgi:hypothetical protein